MSVRPAEGIAGLGIVASAGILAAMLAAPWLVAEGPGPSVAPDPSATASGPGASASPGLALPPLGSFQLDTPLDFGRICLGIELAAGAYPVAPGARGTATVSWWESSIIDSGHPDACATRAGELEVEEAVVERIPDEDDPDGPPIGYSLLFHLPGPTGAVRDMELALLTAQSTPDRLQALDMTTSGSGLVFERVSAIDPPFVPAPSASPTPVAWPDGLFLLRGPLAADGPCLVLEMTAPPPPAAPGAVGTASIRWWDPGGEDPADPAFCLSRIGDVQVGPAQISTMLEGDDPAGIVGFDIHFVLPVEPGAAPQDVLVSVPVDQVTPDQLVGTAGWGDGPQAVAFDRVDSIDPPLAPAP
jgi:hypothetical protein